MTPPSPAPEARHVKRKPAPSIERVREAFYYEPTTGLLYRCKKGGRLFGPIGTERPDPKRNRTRLVVYLDKSCYYVHVIIWYWMTGQWPELQIEHRDLNEMNNIWDNLRLATHAQNVVNRLPPSTNTSGYKGVYRTLEGRWTVRLGVAGRSLYFGTFDTPEEAARAYDTAAIKTFGEFAKVNFSGETNV